MSQFDDLVSELSPSGVEFRPLGELLKFEQPGKYLVESTSYSDEFATPVLTAGQTFLLGYTDEMEGIYQASVDAPVIIFDDFTTAFRWVDFAFKAKSSAMKMLSVRQDAPVSLRYVYYATRKIRFSPQDHARQWISNYSAFRIPVPPLRIQHEIVAILDRFIRLEAELEAELEARSRQYGYFAAGLLANSKNDRSVRFGDVANIVRGASPRPIQSFITQSEDGIPWIKIGDVPADGKYIAQTKQRVTAAGAAKSRRVRRGDFVPSNSMSFGRPYISQIEGAIHDGWLAISDFSDSFVPDYLYYLLRSGPVQDEFARRAGAGTVRNLNADIVKSISLPLPSRERQLQVVALLNRFDLLVNDLSAGLPAELAARRKQYEHYRDRLLTFKELAA